MGVIPIIAKNLAEVFGSFPIMGVILEKDRGISLGISCFPVMGLFLKQES